uniref:Peptidase C2 calpain large subunit domain-containing protein n=1 Tax=Panagrolaimus sp. JU765 TaxID=591449 RepID=A0AC34QAZ6_9BILA
MIIEWLIHLKKILIQMIFILKNWKIFNLKCNLGPDVNEEVAEMTGVKAGQHAWAVNSHDGSWKNGTSAGGCRNYLRSFAMNPQ